MKTVILAGGFGTRLSEYTDVTPKPMVTIGGKPILWHIMNSYAKFGFNDFIIAVGYKSEIIKSFFLNYASLNSDFTVDLSSGDVKPINFSPVDWKVTLVDTGLHTMTGGRLRRLKSYIGDGPFMLTYGDGLSNINICELLSFHQSHGKLMTVSAVRPSARFGGLGLDGNTVRTFVEKPQLLEGWINGGFFVIDPKFLDYIDDDQTSLERKPMELAAANNQLMAYKHDGFWQCMDTKKDRDTLENLWLSGAPWHC